jgi:dimethylargininase
MQQAEWEIVEIPAANDCPDSVFVEDTMVAYGEIAVVSRPALDARRPETEEVAKIVECLGLTLHHIGAPGTLEGGDVLKVRSTVYVGTGGRTNEEGAAQLGRILKPYGASVVTVPLRRVLHLKSVVTALPDGTILGYPPLIDDVSIFPNFLPVPEVSGANVVLLGDSRVLMAANAPLSAHLLCGLGYTPVIVDISEFQKLEGSTTCLSVQLA